MSVEESKFDLWWNSPAVKRMVGIVFSLGAAVVIVGAMFKILHLPGASFVLGIGMTVEAVLFALGIFDKPHHEYEWHKVFDFENESKQVIPAGAVSSTPAQAAPQRAVGLNYSESISDDDVQLLSQGIKNLATTAQQFSSLSNVVGSTEQFVKTIDGATQATAKYTTTQDSLNGATVQLAGSYNGILDKMDAVEKSTKLYATKVEDINKNLSSINSIYEIQLKNIQAQSEGLTLQTDQLRSVSNELNVILGDTEKMREATNAAADATEKYKLGTVKLAKQVADLNQVYGNMLNALN